jgi:hypothetical protein
MKTALVIGPGVGSRHRQALERLLEDVYWLAFEHSIDAKVYFQNNLKTGTLAVMVEAGNRTFGGAGKTFLKAVAITVKDIQRFRRRNGKLRPTAKQASRTTHGKRRRR